MTAASIGDHGSNKAPKLAAPAAAAAAAATTAASSGDHASNKAPKLAATAPAAAAPAAAAAVAECSASPAAEAAAAAAAATTAASSGKHASNKAPKLAAIAAAAAAVATAAATASNGGECAASPAAEATTTAAAAAAATAASSCEHTSNKDAMEATATSAAAVATDDGALCDDAAFCDTPEKETASVAIGKSNKRLQRGQGGRKKESVGQGGGFKSGGGFDCHNNLWTEEEEKQEEYGVKRSLLKQYQVQKCHVENMQRVQSSYSALREVMDFLFSRHIATPEEVANAISGVPMLGETLMEKKSLNEWFRDKILCPPKQIPVTCQYPQIARHARSQEKSKQQRSARMYLNKMKAEFKQVEVVECRVHPQETGTCLEMSK